MRLPSPSENTFNLGTYLLNYDELEVSPCDLTPMLLGWLSSVLNEFQDFLEIRFLLNRVSDIRFQPNIGVRPNMCLEPNLLPVIHDLKGVAYTDGGRGGKHRQIENIANNRIRVRKPSPQ